MLSGKVLPPVNSPKERKNVVSETNATTTVNPSSQFLLQHDQADNLPVVRQTEYVVRSSVPQLNGDSRQDTNVNTKVTQVLYKTASGRWLTNADTVDYTAGLEVHWNNLKKLLVGEKPDTIIVSANNYQEILEKIKHYPWIDLKKLNDNMMQVLQNIDKKDKPNQTVADVLRTAFRGQIILQNIDLPGGADYKFTSDILSSLGDRLKLCRDINSIVAAIINDLNSGYRCGMVFNTPLEKAKYILILKTILEKVRTVPFLQLTSQTLHDIDNVMDALPVLVGENKYSQEYVYASIAVKIQQIGNYQILSIAVSEIIENNTQRLFSYISDKHLLHVQYDETTLWQSPQHPTPFESAVGDRLEKFINQSLELGESIETMIISEVKLFANIIDPVQQIKILIKSVPELWLKQFFSQFFLCLDTPKSADMQPFIDRINCYKYILIQFYYKILQNKEYTTGDKCEPAPEVTAIENKIEAVLKQRCALHMVGYKKPFIKVSIQEVKSSKKNVQSKSGNNIPYVTSLSLPMQLPRADNTSSSVARSDNVDVATPIPVVTPREKLLHTGPVSLSASAHVSSAAPSSLNEGDDHSIRKFSREIEKRLGDLVADDQTGALGVWTEIYLYKGALRESNLNDAFKSISLFPDQDSKIFYSRFKGAPSLVVRRVFKEFKYRVASYLYVLIKVYCSLFPSEIYGKRKEEVAEVEMLVNSQIDSHRIDVRIRIDKSRDENLHATYKVGVTVFIPEREKSIKKWIFKRGGGNITSGGAEGFSATASPTTMRATAVTTTTTTTTTTTSSSRAVGRAQDNNS